MTPSTPPSAEAGKAPPGAVSAWQRYDADEQRLSAHVSERMLDLAGLQPGWRVLDIASGRGEPALRAAARVAPDGRVLATDTSDEMLDFGRRRAALESVGNLGFRVSPADTLAGVTERDFDAALCRWGLMFFDRPQAALASTRERLRAGGALVLAVWAAPAQVPWWSMPRAVLARHAALPPLDLAAPGPCRHADAARLRADLRAAGFAVQHEESLSTPVMEAATPDGLIDWCLAFGIGRSLAGQPAAVGAAWRRDMVEEAERFREADGLYRLGGLTHLVKACAPGH